MKFNALIFLLISISVVSCAKKKETYESAMRPRIDSLLIEYKKPVKEIIILPTSGCTGCVQSGEQYMLQHLNNDSILFVLTEIHSLKSLELRFGKDVLLQSNVYIDSLDYFYPPYFEEVIYPFIGEIDDDKLLKFYPL